MTFEERCAYKLAKLRAEKAAQPQRPCRNAIEKQFTEAFYELMPALVALSKTRRAAPPERLATVERLKAMMAEAARTCIVR